MTSALLTTGVSLIVIYCFVKLRALRQNLAKARQSGLPYVIAPVYFQTVWWMVLGPSLSRLLWILPKAWSERWLPLSLFGRVWHAGHEPFALIGNDTFIMVSPGGNVLWTCDPEAILQFSKRHHDFVKPVEMMGMLNLYGPTITATEGEESRRYRKTAGPAFNEKTHNAVWTESLRQATALLETWTSLKDGITKVNDDLAKLTLHVISYVCFDRQIGGENEIRAGVLSTREHSMSYSEAISSMVENIPILFLVPPFVLDILPLASFRRAKTSYGEWKAYMEDMRDETAETLEKGSSKNDASLLECFVKASRAPDSEETQALLSPDAVLGNLFVFIMAGHETSANTLTYAITLLACRPDLQKAMQSDIDLILGNRGPDEWSFELDFHKLLNGYVGAVMNETLRLYTVLPFLPKTTREVPKSLTLGGREYSVPPDTLILMNTSATHRNPKHWPAAAPKSLDGPPYPVSSFNPDQWLQTESRHEGNLNPVPGSYIPFSDGPRACMGKRFAQVQFCAVMASFFRDYSVELCHDLGPDTSPNDSMKNAQRELSDGVGFLMSLKMDGNVPLKFVKRSEMLKTKLEVSS